MIAGFARSLRRRDSAPPAGLTTWNGSCPAQRFAIYRNNVAASLIAALAAKYPLIEALVGEDYFKALAGAFVRDHLPGAPRLALYGEGFAEFLAAFAPVRDWPYLADVARLEAAQLAAMHAADAEPLGAADFATAHDLAAARLELHPSLRLVASRFAVGAIADALDAGLGCAGVDPDEPQEVIVARPRLSVLRLVAPAGTARFLEALRVGAPVFEAVAAARRGAQDFDAAQAFALVIARGLATRFVTQENEP